MGVSRIEAKTNYVFTLYVCYHDKSPTVCVASSIGKNVLVTTAMASLHCIVSKTKSPELSQATLGCHE